MRGRGRPGNLALLSVNKAKGLDSLAVIMIDVERFDKLATPQEQMNYFMGASRARQLLAVFHKANRDPIEMAYLSWQNLSPMLSM